MASNFPKRHPREIAVASAEREISDAVAQSAANHELTYGEIFKILSGLISHYAKYAIRSERHPDDPSKPGGFE